MLLLHDCKLRWDCQPLKMNEPRSLINPQKKNMLTSHSWSEKQQTRDSRTVYFKRRYSGKMIFF